MTDKEIVERVTDLIGQTYRLAMQESEVPNELYLHQHFFGDDMVQRTAQDIADELERKPEAEVWASFFAYLDYCLDEALEAGAYPR